MVGHWAAMVGTLGSDGWDTVREAMVGHREAAGSHICLEKKINSSRRFLPMGKAGTTFRKIAFRLFASFN